MKISDLIARAREQEEYLRLELVRQQGRVEGLQEALSLAGGIETLEAATSSRGCRPVTGAVLTAATPEPKPVKSKAAPKPVNNGKLTPLMKERRDKLLEVLTAESPLNASEISRRSGIPDGSLHRHLNDPAFARQPDGRWALAVQTSAPVEPAKPETPKVEPVKPTEVKPVKAVEPKPTKKPVSENTRAYRRHKIAQTLSGGSLTLIEVARKINLTYDDALEICQDDPWFSQDPAGRWHITPQCRSEFFDDSNPATGD